MPGITDGELARAARAGEVAALGVLLERHRAGLHAHALGLLGHGADAQDAVQDTFFTALRRIGDVREPEAIGGWLHAVLRNACLARLRSAGREAPLDAAARLRSPLPEPEEEIDRLALREWVRTALDRLSEPLRLVAMLRLFGAERSYEEIASICGVPVGTVRSRLSQVRLRLADELLAVAGLPHGDAGTAHAGWTEHFDRVGAGRVDEFLSRMAPDVVLELRGVGTLRGRGTVSSIVEEDRQDGVGFEPVQVVAGRGITVFEARFVNPPDDPLHCPPGITQVHFHAAGVTRRMVWHRAPREPRATTPA